ncbi:c-type cytochrome [Pricia antarctica]|uniref:c-type cytochrome n=1 Tax=Pricia antarctica TaxID=641691 RepID=UPI0015872DCC|nr:cytochrome c [Pricia antarctica]
MFIFLIGSIYGCGEKKKENDTHTKPASEQESEVPSPVESADVPEYMAEGQKVYAQYCLSCHQVNGTGVSRLNPPLKDTDYVLGDKNRLLGILVNGSNVGLEIRGETYSNAMPSFKQLDDTELAHVASYIRNSFGNSATPVTIGEVSTFRTKSENQK